MCRAARPTVRKLGRDRGGRYGKGFPTKSAKLVKAGKPNP
jgi:hypothetical protein